MAKLTIKGFLSISNAEVDLKRLTVFIGPQAQGKSLVLKLVHFFEAVLNRAIIDVVTGDVTIATLRKESLERFETYFPKYSWGTSGFSVTYSDGSFVLSIARSGGRRNSPATLSLNATLDEALKAAHADYKGKYESIDVTIRNRTLVRRNLLPEVISEVAAFERFRAEPVFIPASRSFFANVEKNIFTLISSKFELDLLMAEFGTMLESTRRNLLLFGSLGGTRGAKKKKELRKSDWAHIINGDYVFDGEEESIEVDGRKVLIGNSSSGQQEAIPMLLVLDFFSGEEAYTFGRVRGTRGASFFVEEPEAHLFPKAQRAISTLLIEAMSRSQSNRVMFTTHSPYMLTAINNLNLAGQLLEHAPAVRRTAVIQAVGAEHAISPGELAAYKVDGGSVESIVDSRTGLVNGMLIDEVSMDFAREFDELLSLRAASKRQI